MQSWCINVFYLGGNSELSDKWKKEFLPEHCVSSVEVFDPATDTWSEGPELPNALCGAGKSFIVLLNRRMFFSDIYILV